MSPILVRRSSGLSARSSSVALTPSMVTVPLSGVMSVAVTASRLDLPDPEGPVMPTVSPAPTCNDT